MYRMVDIDNPGSVGAKLLKKEYRFSFDGEYFYFGEIRSSRVSSIQVDGGTMFVQTKNTKYTFKKCEREP